MVGQRAVGGRQLAAGSQQPAVRLRPSYPALIACGSEARGPACRPATRYPLPAASCLRPGER